MPLLQQLDNFAVTRAEMQLKLGRHELEELLSKSLFLISIGNWDLHHAWWLQNIGIKFDQADVQSVASSLIAGVKALYDAGARKFRVIDVPLLGVRRPTTTIRNIFDTT
ncbi:hypothetical protein U9M48_024722 [Paspalum notatum var. saurae]|uniref:Uncharacterized protein n=1 Tax=Paspalum notatum var. saurae TaxID=547442 RepID=A0AAQ3TPD8_PASNO